MINVIDIETGDLGIPEKVFSVSEFPTALYVAANILSRLRSDKPLAYCLGFHLDATDWVKKYLLIVKLPKGVELYETDGHVVFDLCSATGGIVGSRICYLIRKQ